MIMKKILIVVSLIGLALTILPSVFFLLGKISQNTNFMLMGIGMIIWFASVPFWMKNKPTEGTEK